MLRAALSLGPLLAASAAAQCPPPGQITLGSEEFEVAGYDAQRGVVGIRPVSALPAGALRPRALRLAVPDQPILMRVSSDQFQAITEARAAGGLALRLQVQSAPGPRPPGDCATLQPLAAALELGGLVLGEPPEAEPAPAPAAAAAGVRLGGTDPEPPDARFPTARIHRAVTEAAEVCLAQAEAPTLTGALVVELGLSPAGEPRPSKVVVDQLLDPAFNRCLTRKLDACPGLWADWPTGGLVYQSLYLRPGGKAPSGAEDSRTKAP